jgi:hypothetical protein
MRSLNVDKGTTINELEIMFAGIYKLIDKQLEENPKAGIIMAKGKPNETRMKYKDLKEVVHKMQDYFESKGCMSLGICKTCTNFNSRGTIPNYYGLCRNRDSKHEYDSCDQHSYNGGGFGR